MVVRLANGATVQMAKRVIRLKMRFEQFRGEDEFILLDLDEKFGLILGMPWLKCYQPCIDWSTMKISVGPPPGTSESALETDMVAWAYTSVEEIPDVPSEIAESDGPPRSRGSPKCHDVVVEQQPQPKNGGGAVRRQKKTVSFALAHGEARSADAKNGNQDLTRVVKTHKRIPPRSTPDQGEVKTTRSGEGSVQARGTSTEYVNVAVYNKDGGVSVARRVKIENPPRSVQELTPLPRMSRKQLKHSLLNGEIQQLCAIVVGTDEGSVNTTSCADAGVFDERTRSGVYRTLHVRYD